MKNWIALWYQRGNYGPTRGDWTVMVVSLIVFLVISSLFWIFGPAWLGWVFLMVFAGIFWKATWHILSVLRQWLVWWYKESDLGPKKGNWSIASKALIVFLISGFVCWIFGSSFVGGVFLGALVISFWIMIATA